MVGVEVAESEVAVAGSDVGAVCVCGLTGEKCTAAAAAAEVGDGLNGCGFVQTSLVVSCSFSILGNRRTWSESEISKTSTHKNLAVWFIVT